MIDIDHVRLTMLPRDWSIVEVSVTGVRERAFVGRTAELALLADRFRHAWAGRGGVAVIAGEAGIGKTSLARAAAAEAQRAGVRLLWGRAYEGGWSPPFGPWVEALGA